MESYLKEIAAITKRGDAREESYYGTLEALLEHYSSTHRKKIVHVTTIPQKTEGGNPDFRVWDGKHSIVGYVEAKKPSVALRDVEDTEQIERYVETFPNFILTNFYEFWLYRNGKLVDKVLLARPFIASKLKTVPPAEREDEFLALLERFFDYSRPKKYTAEMLARELAVLTRFLRDEIIKGQLAEEETKGEGALYGFYQAFRDTLIANLTTEQFADLYAQTLTYGLFAARTRSENGFNRKLAYTLIPKTIGILRDIFRFISVEEPPQQLEWIVDDIAEVLDVADVKDILGQYFKRGKGTDPIFHFYETFLAEYNPQERERRGVYYTPEPVVSYIVRSLNIILKETFGRQDGFATHSVTVLDPAGGTLTFLAEAAKLAVVEFAEKYGSGAKGALIQDHILQHFFAFELMMAPYAAGHLKMGYLLEELGHKLSGDDRFQFYLTNTLEMEELVQTSLPGMASLSEESHLAGKVKSEKPILVILGNPPYSGHSANKGDWISEQIENYKVVDGKPLGEKNPKWLQDDYVKFIRFARWKIELLGEGVIGFITNHSYLDNPTFRGMRQSLMNSFDEIYILDLHGNSLKKEKAPDGSKDENVFDIQQGVTIGLFVNRKKVRGKKSIRQAELWGLREKKYTYLQKYDLKKTKWNELYPAAPFYLFVPRDEKRSKRFLAYWSLPDIFPVNSVGIVTARDHLTIHWNKHDIWTTVLNFSQLEPEMARNAYKLGPDARDWKVILAQEDLKKSGMSKDNIVPILYRPFDVRFTYYTGNSKGFHCMPRDEVMRHLLEPNLGLLTPKQAKKGFGAFVSDAVAGHKAVEAFDINYCFPFYLYNEEKDGAGSGRRSGAYQMMMAFEPKTDYRAGSKPSLLQFLNKEEARLRHRPNLNPALVESLETAYKRDIAPEDMFCYIYAVLYSKAYRKKYAEFLKTDFPRVPFTSDYKLFQSLAEKGEKLVALHLLKSKKLNKPISRCEGKGDFVVEKVKYDEKQKCVYINPSKYFTGVPHDVWECHIGGYQVSEKWLKDWKGRVLSSEEISHYCKVVTAITETIGIQKSLDTLFIEAERSLGTRLWNFQFLS